VKTTGVEGDRLLLPERRTSRSLSSAVLETDW